MGYDVDILLRMSPTMREQAQKQIQEQNNARERKAFTAEIEANTKEAPKRDSKYNAKPTDRISPTGEVIRFSSKKEAAYYSDLLIFEKAGKVRNIKLQWQILLKPSYIDGQTGERFRAINYIADFVFERLEDNGEWKEHIVDTKGKKTKEYIMKRKLCADKGIYIEEA